VTAEDTSKIIAWNLKPFGVPVVQMLYDGDGVVYRTMMPGAFHASGMQIMGTASDADSSLRAFWNALTKTAGAYMIRDGKRYEWNAGIFQEIFG
jgi:hypothetical protein